MKLRNLMICLWCILLSACQTEFMVDHSGELYRIRCGEPRLLSLPTTNNSAARWSPDGKKLAYFGHDTNGPALFLTNSAGSRVRNLTDTNAAIPTPDFTWGPQGRWIYFTVVNSNSMYSIYRIDVESTSARPQPLTPLDLNSLHPSVSPSGDKLVYASTGPSSPDKYDLYTDWTHGTNRTLLYSTPEEDDYLPSWGPDGRIAFVRSVARRISPTVEAHYYEVVLLEAPELLIALGAYSGNLYATLTTPDKLDWSSDGNFIAFIGGADKIYIARTHEPYDSRCLHCPGLNVDKAPHWYKSDEKIVFTRFVNDIPPVGAPQGGMTINVDGSDETLLMRNSAGAKPRPSIKNFCL